jgi:ketosteroid isomerase-like protein
MIDEVRRIFEEMCAALDARDVERALRVCAPDVAFVSYLDAVEGNVRRGHDGVRRWFEDLDSTFAEVERQPGEVHELSDDLFMGRVSMRGRGRASGAPLDVELFVLGRARDGKAAWWHFYGSRDEALGAADQLLASEGKTAPSRPSSGTGVGGAGR